MEEQGMRITILGMLLVVAGVVLLVFLAHSIFGGRGSDAANSTGKT